MDPFDNIGKRDNWKDRAALYRNGTRTNTQAGEDLVARRILNGLGYTEKGICKLEASLDLPYDASKPLFDRAKACLEAVSNGMFAPSREGRRFALVCRDTDDVHRPILKHMDEWIDMAEPEKDGLVVMGRVGRQKVAWAYCVMRDDVLPPWILQHPAVLLRRDGGWWVWYREVSSIVFDMVRFEHWSVPGSVDLDLAGRN